MKERRNEGTKERTRALSKARRTNELRARGFVVRPSVRPSVHTANSTTPPTTVHYAIQPSALCTSPPQIQPPSSIAKVYNNDNNERRRRTTNDERRTTTNDDVRTTYPELALHCATATSRAHLRICVHHSRPLQASIKQHRHLRLLRFVSWLVARWGCRPTLRRLPSARVVVRCLLAWLGTCKRS